MTVLATLATSSSPPRDVIRTFGHGTFRAVMGLCLALGGLTLSLPALAAESSATKPADVAVSRTAPSPSAKAKTPTKKVLPAELPPEPASDAQRSAAERVYYGEYQCEFKQVVYIKPSEQHPAYVDLRFAKSSYLMKPVLSSTGAIRLEDVKGQTLMVQIASKSMLLNVKAGNRLVDECVGDGHRAEVLAARQRAEQETEPSSLSNSISASAKSTP